MFVLRALAQIQLAILNNSGLALTAQKRRAQFAANLLPQCRWNLTSACAVAPTDCSACTQSTYSKRSPNETTGSTSFGRFAGRRGSTLTCAIAKQGGNDRFGRTIVVSRTGGNSANTPIVTEGLTGNVSRAGMAGAHNIHAALPASAFAGRSNAAGQGFERAGCAGSGNAGPKQANRSGGGKQMRGHNFLSRQVDGWLVIIRNIT